jgi:hypothetical protein
MRSESGVSHFHNVVRPWHWLVGMVALSALVRVGLGSRVAAPWIMVDELEYSELAKSFAAHGHFSIRGASANGYGFVYPIVIASAFRVFGSVPHAYAAAKVINAVLMSSAAVPTYFLARRVVDSRRALVVAALALLVPSLLYTGTLMTENAFYPLFLTCALVLVSTLERPTARRQVVLLALCALAYVTRVEAAALVAAVVSAPVLLVLVERRGLGALRPFATLYGIVGGLLALALVVQAARGPSPLALLGAYRAATASDYEADAILRFFVYHVAELDLYVGIVPAAALAYLWLAPRALPPPVRVFAVSAGALVFWLLAEVSAFASQTSVDKIEERNTFYVAPLFLLALVYLLGVAGRRRQALLAACTIVGLLPVFIPYGHFVGPSATADTFALLPWWWVNDHGVSLDDMRWVALTAGIAASCVPIVLPRRYAPALLALVGAYFVLTTAVVANGRHGIEVAARGKLHAAIDAADRDWIDRLVGASASVAVLYTGSDPAVTWENEFFNRSVDRILDFGALPPDPLPATSLLRAASGVLVAGSAPARADYLLAPTAADVKGTLVGRDGVLGYALYRVNGALRVLSQITGLYPDTWSRRTVTYRRIECAAGLLAVRLVSDPSLFTQAQVVTASEAGRVVRRASVPPAEPVTLVVPLRPSHGVCTVRFRIAHLLNPSLREHNTDDRLVGIHFASFTYRPSDT